jgi:hypothetical protein
MKKIIALMLLPSFAFAGKLGENYVGAELGSSDIEFIRTATGDKVTTDSTGFSWEISGNYNIYNPSDKKYAADLLLSYYTGSGKKSATSTSNTKWTTDTELSVLTAVVRPYYDLGSFKVFADLGVSAQDYEIDVTQSGGSEKVSGDSTEFSYGVGFEVASGKLSLTPSVSWSESPSIKGPTAGTYKSSDSVSFIIPVSYSYSDKIDITASYRSIDNDDAPNKTTPTSKVKTETSSWGIGIDYKF